MLDLERIRELRDEIGEDDFAEVAVVFIDELEEVIGKLREGGSPEQTREWLHFLKGCALNLGLSGLAEQALKGEGGQLDLTELVSVYTASRAEFDKATGGAAAA